MCSGSATLLASSALCAALWALDAFAQEVRVIVQSSALAGFRFHAAAEVWEELRVGEIADGRGYDIQGRGQPWPLRIR